MAGRGRPPVPFDPRGNFAPIEDCGQVIYRIQPFNLRTQKKVGVFSTRRNFIDSQRQFNCFKAV